MKSVLVAISVIALSATAACTSDDDDGGGDPITIVADAAPPDAAPVPDAQLACVDYPDFQSCANCYAAENPTGAEAYNQGIVDNCLCANECVSVCTAECANPATLTAGCEQCVNGLGPQSRCVQGFGNQCRAKPECLQFAGSLQSCPQE
jgi:hypothetical protein